MYFKINSKVDPFKFINIMSLNIHTKQCFLKYQLEKTYQDLDKRRKIKGISGRPSGKRIRRKKNSDNNAREP